MLRDRDKTLYEQHRLNSSPQWQQVLEGNPRATQGLAGQERLSGVWPVRDDLDAFPLPD